MATKKNSYDEKYDRWGDVPGSIKVIKPKKQKTAKAQKGTSKKK